MLITLLQGDLFAVDYLKSSFKIFAQLFPVYINNLIRYFFFPDAETPLISF